MNNSFKAVLAAAFIMAPMASFAGGLTVVVEEAEPERAVEVLPTSSLNGGYVAGGLLLLALAAASGGGDNSSSTTTTN